MTETLEAIARLASAALISSVWQGVILAALIWFCVKLLPRISAGVRFGIWSATFAATAMLPLFSIVARTTPTVISAGSLTHSTAPMIVLDGRWALFITAVWALFTVARLLVLGRNALGLHALWKSSQPVELTTGIRAVLTKPGLRGAALCTSPAVDQPCVIGFFSPRILIPAWLLKTATPSELEQIVLHESAHLRRFDDWTNLAQKLALAPFPLNPALFWLERRLCAEREGACDESVVLVTNAPRDYANCLTHLAEQRLARRTLGLSGALSLGAWERRSQLASRVESILLGRAALGTLQTRALALSVVLATICGAIKLGTASQVVSFTSVQSNASVAETNPISTAGPHYQDVVFHAPSTSVKPALTNRNTARPLKRLTGRSFVKGLPRSVEVPGNGMKSLVIVTRWQSIDGQQMTVIDRVVRISALSAAQSQGGWFVVQL